MRLVGVTCDLGFVCVFFSFHSLLWGRYLRRVEFHPFSEKLNKRHISVTTHPRYLSIHFSLSPHINIFTNSFKLVSCCLKCAILEDVTGQLIRLGACHC